MRSKANRLLEQALWLALIVHIVALLTMAGILIHAMPGVPGANVELRASYVANHSWLWHAGWIPWHLCALSDLLLSLALVKADWVTKLPAYLTLAVTVIAATIEQTYESAWDLAGPHQAALALRTANLPAYAAFEHHVYVPVCVVAAVLYAIMAMGWSLCLAAASTWTKLLTWVSIVTWPLLLLLGASPLLPGASSLPPILTMLGNIAGFNLMVLWFILALVAILRLSRISAS